MSTLTQIREGLSRAWDSITEGWRELREMAAEALTRFHPVAAEDGTPPQRRAVQLPAAVDEASAKARYDAGVLTVRLPKVERQRRSRITIEQD